MKFALTLLALLIPLEGFSPQEGGGGNVCYYRGELVMLDEFYADYGSVSHGIPSTPVKPVYGQDANGEPVLDFTRMDTTHVFLKTLAWYGDKLDQDLFRELRDYFMALDNVYIKKEHFTEAWSPDGHDRIGCAKGFMRAMIVSTPEGVTIVSTKDWEALHPQRKQIAMFHETLRLSQLHTEWFKDVLNDELSELTMMLYQGAMRDITSHPAWGSVLRKLKSELYTTLSVKDIKQSLLVAQDGLESHLESGQLKLAVKSVSEISLLLKQLDIKEGREPGLHFSNEMRKLRTHPLYSAKIPELVQGLRNL